MTMPVRRLTLTALLAVPLALAPPASAQEGSATRGSMTLTVSKATGLAADGEKVRVRGSGYDPNKGIYVAFCVIPPAGQTPTPCGGGADTEGRSGNSVWISDFPPAYGIGLAQPYGAGGSFDVEISVRAQLKEDVDCRKVRCAVVTRADHTRSEDRTADVFVPITFTAPAAAPAPPPAATASAAPTSAATGTPASRGAGSTAVTSSSTQAATTAPTAPAPSMPSAAPTAPASPSASASAPEAPVAVADDTTVAAPEQQIVAATPIDVDTGGGIGWPLAAAGLLALAGAGLGAGRVLLSRRAARLRG